MRSLLVKVTADHIAKGKRSDCEACPIALALQEADPRHRIWDVGIGAEGAYASTMGSDYIELSTSAANFVGDFDNARPVRAFTFYVAMPA